MIALCNPCARAQLHQQKRARKLCSATLTSVLDDTTPQLAEQTFNINNWGLGNIERKLLADIKAKIDSLSDKGKLLYNSKQSP